MSELRNDLLAVVARLERAIEAARAPEARGPIEAFRLAATSVGRAWSGSSLGYYARVYYEGFREPPRGVFFTGGPTRWYKEWRRLYKINNFFEQVYRSFSSGRGTLDPWVEFDDAAVRDEISKSAPPGGLIAALEAKKIARQVFEESQVEVLSILSVALLNGKSDNGFLSAIKSEIETMSLETSKEQFAWKRAEECHWEPPGDERARNEGRQVPPHIDVLAEIDIVEATFKTCSDLNILVGRAESHLARLERGTKSNSRDKDSRVFLGHGRSPAWLELKDFIKERLGLPIEEFNRVPAAGASNKERLSEMLDASAMAFLILTGEDEQAGGRVYARQNVVHEAGLFQGRHGFNRAIILLEEGCETFSNLDGLVHIAFPKGRISAAFEEIRRVVEREGLVPTHGSTT